MNILVKISIFFKRLHQFAQKTLNLVFSGVFYFLGIGPTSILSKITGKKFLQKQFIDSSWKKNEQKERLEKKY